MSITEVNLELLIKLMRLTASDNDQEALLAMRKANEQITKVGGDWETLLRGKVTIVQDPFSKIEPVHINKGWEPPPIWPQPAPKRSWNPPPLQYASKPKRPPPVKSPKLRAAAALTLDDLEI